MQEKSTTHPVTPMSPADGKRQLIQEVGEICFRCYADPKTDFKIALVVDHIVPVARGGMNVYENYQLLCGPCNSWKGTKVVDFRPGKSRKEITVDLPIIPNELRVRKSRRIRKPAPIPTPPLPQSIPASPRSDSHDCRETVIDSLLRANAETMERQAETIAELRERVGRAETRAELEARRANDLAKRLVEAEERLARPWWRRIIG